MLFLLLHVIKNYSAAKHIWLQLIPENKHKWFFTRDLKERLVANLQISCGFHMVWWIGHAFLG